MRFPVIVLIVGLVLLIFVAQAQDALLVIVAGALHGDQWAIVRLLSFYLFVLLWAFNSFYAARFMSRLPPQGRARLISEVRINSESPSHLYPPPFIQAGWIARLNRHLPRIIGGCVIGIATSAVMRASCRLNVVAVVCVLLAGCGLLTSYILTVVYRRRIFKSRL